MTDWSEEKLVYDGDYWTWDSIDPTTGQSAGWDNQFSGWDSRMVIFTEELLTYGVITEEVP